MPTPSPETWHNLSAHLDHALALSSETRTRYLASLYHDDPSLAAALSELLREHQDIAREGFLETPLVAWPGGDTSLAGRVIGAYTLIEHIGQGGMGTIWLAARNDGRFERRVALKFLSAAVSDAAGEQRFLREGRILGRLAHPHIAELLDAGVWHSHPYLVLEYVPGEHIDRLCDRRRLGTVARLRLFLDVLDAVAYAHANLIVHRDIKPSNLLVTDDGDVKLLDFGIAKLLDPEGAGAGISLLTREAGAALTPLYAAPEQLNSAPVTTATDVYALGVLLYVLLTGQHPAGPGPLSSADLVRSILDVEPPCLSEVARTNRALRGDLDTIARKTLKKEPRERYPSVTALADDVRRFLNSEPIRARPDTLAYRTSRFVRRNRTPVAIAAVAVVATIAGLVGTLAEARSARAERDFALRQLSRAEAINELNSFVLSDAAPSGKPLTVNELLGRAERLVAHQNGGGSDQVELLIAVGRQYWSQDEDNSARRVLDQAYRLSRTAPDPSTRARAACALASALARGLEGPGRAEALIREGLGALPAQPQFALDRIFCLERGSEVAREEGSANEAVARARQAQALLDGSVFRTDLLDLRALMELAEAYRAAGQNLPASATFERASAILSALGRDETQTAGTLLNNWGLAEWALGHPLRADRMFRRAIAVSSSGGNQQSVSPMLLTNEARTLRALARFDEAADYAERANSLARQSGDEVVVTQALSVRASVYLAAGDPARSEQLWSEVESRLRRKLPAGHVAFANLAAERAGIAEARGDLADALGLVNEALRIVDATAKAGRGGSEFVPYLLVRRSAIELALRRPNAAANDATSALNIIRASAAPGVYTSALGRTYLALGRALAAEGRHDQAAGTLRTALEHLDRALGAEHPDTEQARKLAIEEAERPQARP